MKHPKAFAPRRPQPGNMAKARTRKDAAVQLVALEFGVERLERELSLMREKMAYCSADLARKESKRRKLVRKLMS